MGWRKVFRTRGDMGATAVSHAQRTADFVQRTAYFSAGNFQERENIENLLRDDRENLGKPGNLKKAHRQVYRFK